MMRTCPPYSPCIGGALAALLLLGLGVAPARALGPPHDGSNGVRCADCHDRHGGTMGQGYTLPRGETQAAVCRVCHTPVGGGTPRPPVANHVVGGGATELDCGTCHEPHGAEVSDDPHAGGAALPNLALIRAAIGKYAGWALESAVFQARPAHFAFGPGAAPWNGVCQVCHTQTAHHTRDASGDHDHQMGLDCMGCHKHQDGFQPSAGCLSCHDKPQGALPRRQIVPHLGDGKGDFARPVHHVAGSVSEADCVVCHDISRHGSQVVRLWNVDTGEVIPAAPGADLSAFCSACHDADGAPGGPPFTDGLSPPDVGAGFPASAHGPLPGGCMTGGCHDNAHGNDAPYLLGAREEAVCLACHGAGGQAVTDVEPEFAQAFHHDIYDADQQASGAKVECTDCHNPHVSTLVQPLVNPDQPLQLHSGPMRVFCLACHDGNAPPKVVMPAVSGGTGLDKSAFPGTPHDLQFAGDCLTCHHRHGTPYVGIALGSYAFTGYLKTDTAQAYGANFGVCAGCHTYTGIFQTDPAFGKHKDHLKDAEAPCAICHDPHAPYEAGEPGLIDFGVGVDHGWGINLFANGQPYTLATAFSQSQQRCWLTCHGKQHKPKKY